MREPDPSLPDSPDPAPRAARPGDSSAPTSRRDRLLLFGLALLLIAADLALLETLTLSVEGHWNNLGPAGALLFWLTQSALWGLFLLPLFVLHPILGHLILDRAPKGGRLGELVSAFWGLDPRQASQSTATLFALLLTPLICAGAMVAVSVHNLENFQETSLIPWLLGATVAVLVLLSQALFLAIRHVTAWVLLRLVWRVPVLGVLSSPRALLPLFFGFLLAVGYWVRGQDWPILQSIPLDETLVFSLLSALVLTAWVASENLPVAAWVLHRAPSRRRLVVFLGGVFLGLQASSLVIMHHAMIVRDLVINESVVSGQIVQVVQQTVDFDGDGYSMLYGGGDCNDFNASVFPNALEIPDDGIDNNCIAGDFSEADFLRPPHEMHPLPEDLPPIRNAILIVVDALRAESTSLNGYEKDTTPKLKAIADKSCVTFTRAYSTGPKTNLSMGAFLFGKRVGRLNWTRGSGAIADISPHEPSLAEKLTRLGYDASAFSIMRFHANVMPNFLKGFDFHSYHTWAPEYRRNHLIPVSALYTDELIRHMGQRKNRKKPYFLYAHYFDPHAPYIPPDDFAIFGKDALGRYLGEILHSDYHIGRFHSWLKSSGHLKDTVFIVTADHGEGVGKHKAWSHGQNLFEEQIHVPLMICAPGITPRRVDTPVSLVDIPPTLANLMDFSPRRDWEGRSLVPAMLGEDLPPLPVVAEIMPDNKNRRHMTAVLLEDDKLIYNHVSHVYALYNLIEDPEETLNRFSFDHAPRRTLLPILHRVIDEGSALRGARKANIVTDEPPEDMKRLDVHFDDGISLLGYTFTPSKPRPGDTVNVRLVWNAVERPSGNYRIFFHIESSRKIGKRHKTLRADHGPADNLYPTREWVPGEIILDDFSFVIPANWPRGETKVWVGMWEKERLDFVAPPPLKKDDRKRLLLKTFRL